MNQQTPKKPLNKNPILVFALLVLIAMIIFRFISPREGGFFDNKVSQKKEASYFELKQMAKNKE